MELPDPRKSLVILGAGLAALLLSLTRIQAGALEKEFAHPPASAKPWVYAFWLNGNITREGITADLEAMQRVGIGGIMLLEVNTTVPPGPIPYASSEWQAMIKYFLDEAARLGLLVNIINAPGWCGSGGPWNTAENSEQQVVWTETFVQGPTCFAAVLPQPKAVAGFYKDIAVLAMPAPLDDDVDIRDFKPRITTSEEVPEKIRADFAAGKPEVKIEMPVPTPGKPQYLQYEFSKPFTARSLSIKLKGFPDWSKFQGELQASDDGVSFRKIQDIGGSITGISLGFDAVTARYFRVVVTKTDGNYPPPLTFSQVEFSSRNRLEDILHKGLSKRGEITPAASYPEIQKELTIPASKIINLTDKMDASGRLNWDVPAGKWLLLRIGHTSRGQKNHPAPQGGEGLEADKLNKAAIDAHFSALMAKVIATAGPLAGKTLVSTHIDSWETGTQNWTAKFRDEFKARRGYDLLPYLPVITGRVVDNQEVSERFLWDFRQTVAELLNENYADHMRELAHEKGLKLSIEGYGSGPSIDLAYGGRGDEPMAEFWWSNSGPKSVHGNLQMPSSAHVYGKKVIPAEAFTAERDERYQAYPGNMKSQGDWAFAMGINRIVFHRYAMQPWPERKPGLGLGAWGTHYERTQTWWEQTGLWHEYLSRCQFLLQEGLPVADICYLQPEIAPHSFKLPLVEAYMPERPGYNFDGAPAEAILTRFSVKDGRLVLPDGMSYRVLVLSDVPTMTPTLLRKIKDLVATGATVIGAPPVKSPSLSDYPNCDAEVKALAAELWGPCDGKAVKERTFGKGKIVWGISPQEVLKTMGVPPDFSQDDFDGKLLYTHRTLDDKEVYFVANPKGQPVTGTCSFRVEGKVPEFWWPETGKIEPAATYTEADGVTTVPLNLKATESVFVVFRPGSERRDTVASVLFDNQQIIPPAKGAKATDTAAVRQDEQGKLRLETWKAGDYTIKTTSNKTYQVRVGKIPAPVPIGGPWELAFPPNWGAPPKITLDKLISWSNSTEPGVKYFSGTAMYTKTIPITADLLVPGNRLYLDLGKVQVIAQVRLNGKDLGILWKPPHMVDITDAAKAGDNKLEIAVTNLWPNRLIGDEQLPEDTERIGKERPSHEGNVKSWPQWLKDGQPSPSGRLTFAMWRLWNKNSTLLTSGLLGPVVLKSQAEAAVK